MKDNRTIVRAVRLKGQWNKDTGRTIEPVRVFKPGQEDELAAALSPEQIAALKAKGVLTGNWAAPEKAEEPSTPEPVVPQEPSTPELDPKISEHLKAAGLETIEDVTAMSDDELIALEGIGEASVKKIRAAFGPHVPAE